MWQLFYGVEGPWLRTDNRVRHSGGLPFFRGGGDWVHLGGTPFREIMCGTFLSSICQE